MGAYTPGEAALNTFLTQYGVGYRSVGLVGTNLCPRVPVPQQYGSVPIFLKDNWLRNPTFTTKAPGEKPKGTSFTLSATSYATVGYQAAENMTVELLDTSDPVDLLSRSAEHTLDQLYLSQEIRIRDIAWSNVGSSTTMTAGASVASAAAIAHGAITQTTGYRANVCVVPSVVFDFLHTKSDITAHGVGANHRARLASVLGVPASGLLVPTAVYNSAQEGQTNSIISVWSTSILFAYVPPAAGPNVPSYMYQLVWGGPRVSGTPAGAVTINATFDYEEGVVRTWGRYFAQEIAVAKELSFLITTGI